MRKLNATIAVGLVLAVLGAALVFLYGRNVDERIADGQETVSVLVAASNLASGTPAESLGQGITAREIPRAYVPEDVALLSLSDVAGQTLRQDVPAGVQLTKAMFGTSGVANAIKPTDGNIALAVGVDITPGVARYIGPESFVDIFVTYTGSGSTTATVANQRTKLFATNVRVLSVSVAPPPEDADSDGGRGESGVVAVLDVPPDMGERVVNATTLGSLYLALSVKGQLHTTPTGVTPDDVVSANQ